MVKDQI